MAAIRMMSLALGLVWVASMATFHYFDPVDFVEQFTISGGGGQIRDFAFDRDGSIWMLRNNAEVEHIQINEDLQTATVISNFNVGSYFNGNDMLGLTLAEDMLCISGQRVVSQDIFASFQTKGRIYTKDGVYHRQFNPIVSGPLASSGGHCTDQNYILTAHSTGLAQPAGTTQIRFTGTTQIRFRRINYDNHIVVRTSTQVVPTNDTPRGIITMGMFPWTLTRNHFIHYNASFTEQDRFTHGGPSFQGFAYNGLYFVTSNG